MPSEVEYEYTWASIDATREKLYVYHDHKLIAKYNYPLPKSSMLLPKIDCQSSQSLCALYSLERIHYVCVFMI